MATDDAWWEAALAYCAAHCEQVGVCVEEIVGRWHHRPQGARQQFHLTSPPLVASGHMYRQGLQQQAVVKTPAARDNDPRQPLLCDSPQIGPSHTTLEHQPTLVPNVPRQIAQGRSSVVPSSRRRSQPRCLAIGSAWILRCWQAVSVAGSCAFQYNRGLPLSPGAPVLWQPSFMARGLVWANWSPHVGR